MSKLKYLRLLLFILLVVSTFNTGTSGEQNTLYYEQSYEFDGPDYVSFTFEVDDQVLYPEYMKDQKKYDTTVFNFTIADGSPYHFVYTYNESMMALQNYSSYFGDDGYSISGYSYDENVFLLGNLPQSEDFQNNETVNAEPTTPILYHHYHKIMNASNDAPYKMKGIIYFEGNNGSLTLKIHPGNHPKIGLLEEDSFLNFHNTMIFVPIIIIPIVKSKFYN